MPRLIGRSQVARLTMAFFGTEIRAWRGQERLSKVFWGYGVAASLILILTYGFAAKQDRVALEQILLLCFAIYTAWVLVAVWRCAPNAAPPWAMLARSLTIAWAANTILIVSFVQIDLARTYLAAVQP